MYKKLAVLSCSIALLYGCASVPMEPNKAGIKAKGTSENLSLLLSFSENDSKTQKNS